MSEASQSKVRQENDFGAERDTLNCVQLWLLIKRAQLTHIYGAGDPMAEVNAVHQETKYSSMRQGDREHISAFKRRFDYQIQATAGFGVAAIIESKRALDFMLKLHPRRFGGMLADMRNRAFNEIANAYQANLTSAFRNASGWCVDGDHTHDDSTDHHS